MHFTKITGFAAFLASANAHFLLNYPQTRGFDEDKEPNICGGFGSSKNRSQFPLSGGIVSITSEHPKSDVDIMVSFDANPTTFGQFNKTSSGNNIPLLLKFTPMNAQGDACFPVNISALGVPDAKDGANATIQVQFNGGDGQLFQCSDVTLSSSFSVPSGTKCQNATGAFPTSDAASSSPSSTAPSSTGGAPASSQSPANGASALASAGFTGLLGVLIGLLVV